MLVDVITHLLNGDTIQQPQQTSFRRPIPYSTADQQHHSVTTATSTLFTIPWGMLFSSSSIRLFLDPVMAHDARQPGCARVAFFAFESELTVKGGEVDADASGWIRTALRADAANRANTGSVCVSHRYSGLRGALNCASFMRQ